METRITITSQQAAEYAKEAIENWDWDASVFYPIQSQDFLDAMRSSLENISLEYAKEILADDDGLIRISFAFIDVWDWLDEFARSTAMNLLAH